MRDSTRASPERDCMRPQIKRLLRRYGLPLHGLCQQAIDLVVKADAFARGRHRAARRRVWAEAAVLILMDGAQEAETPTLLPGVDDYLRCGRCARARLLEWDSPAARRCLITRLLVVDFDQWRHCEDCGVPLIHGLTEYGVIEELRWWEDHTPSSPDEWYNLYAASAYLGMAMCGVLERAVVRYLMAGVPRARRLKRRPKRASAVIWRRA
jgi:hypothetical protein